MTLGSGALLTNAAGGKITGSGTAIVGAGAGTVVNAGSIGGGTDAVMLLAGGTNRLIIDPGATFTGTVDGGNTIGATAVSTLELASGAAAGALTGLGSQFIHFAQGTIDAGAAWTLSGANTLVSGVTLASAGALTNIGTLTLSGAKLTGTGTLVNNGVIVIDPSTMIVAGLTGTGTVTIAADSTLDVTGTVGSGETIDFATTSGAFYLTPGGGGANFAGQIDGFATGNTIALNGITDANAAGIVNGHTLAITTSGEGVIDLTLNPAQSFTGATFNVVDSGGNTVITANDLPCFVAGTRIDAPDGPVAVEALRAGDLVCTASGGARPVRWIGHRHLDLTRHADPRRAQPIRILPGAIADGVPRRDLWVSPDHALFLDGGLVPARLLRNDATIRRESVRDVTYYHVELDAHDILLAEGLAAESYLDTGNRGTFENAADPLVLHPDFTTGNDQARRVALSCAAFVDDADRVAPLWRRMAHRAAMLGHALPSPATTRDPALHLLVDGRRVMPVAAAGNRYSFLLPVTGAVRLCSRRTVPSDLCPWVDDSRPLGVMVRRITLRRDGGVMEMPLDHPGLGAGWWAVEGDARSRWRWTDGDAVLIVPTSRLASLEIELAGTLDYPVRRAAALAA